MVVGVHVVVIGHYRGEELGASVTEELLVNLCVALLHAQHLIPVFLSQLQVDALIYAHGVHGEGDGQECVHLLVLLVNLRQRGEPVSLATCSGFTVPEGAGSCVFQRQTLYPELQWS